jgi:histidine ammonia-lyase
LGYHFSQQLLWQHIENLIVVDLNFTRKLWNIVENPTTILAFAYWLKMQGVELRKENFLGIERKNSNNPRYTKEAEIFKSVFDIDI